MNNFLNVFFELADRQPDRIAMVDMGGERETSFAEMKQLIGRVSAKMNTFGFPRESFIMIRMERRMEYVAAYFGIIASGLAVIPTVLEYPEDRISYIISNSGSPYTVTDGFFEDIGNFEPVYNEDIDPDSVVCMNYTSGSTGNPKGVYYTMRCVSESVLRARLLYDGLDRVVNAAAASLAFAAVCNDCLAPLTLGGTVHLLSDEVRKDANLMMDYYNEHGIVCGNVSPGMLKYFGHTRCLKRIFTTGERVVNAYSRLHEIWCVYGLTEAFAGVTYFPIDRKYSNTPIGKPFGGVIVDILDEEGKAVPDGTEGEIFVTWYLSEGYYGMPDKTAECFTVLPDGMKRFATHDIGYRDENGNIVYVDRKDWMVKINGQRVEPFGVEAVINEVPGVKDAVVKCWQDNGPAYLCAYYIPEDDTLTADDIRTAIGTKLTPYMIPAFFVRMTEFPRTVSGKIDRKSLKAPDHADFLTEYEPPQSREEEIVCSAMEQALHIERVGRTDDFFLLGGDSLAVLELITIIGSDSLRASDIVEGRTPAKIAALLSGKDLLDANGDAACRKKTFPLTEYQKHYYRYWKYAGNIVLGNSPDLFAFDKNLVSAEDLADAVFLVLQNHPAFSMIISEDENGVPFQRFEPAQITRPEIISCKEQEFADITETLIRPFILNDHRLYRCEVYNTEERIYLFLDTHHIASDAASVSIVMKEILSVLNGYRDLKADYFCSWLDRVCRMENGRKNVIMPDESYDRHPVFDVDGNGCLTEMITARLEKTVSEVREEVHSRGNTLLEELTSAALRAVAEYNGSSRVAVNWIYSGRDMSFKNNMAGLLLSSMPVPVDFSDDAVRTDLIGEIRRINHNNLAYSELSPGNSGSEPVADDTITVNYIPYDEIDALTGKEGVERISLINNNTANSNVFYIIARERSADAPFTVMFRFNAEVYNRDNMQRFADIFMEKLGI